MLNGSEASDLTLLRMVAPDASLPLSMTCEEAFVMA